MPVLNVGTRRIGSVNPFGTGGDVAKKMADFFFANRTKAHGPRCDRSTVNGEDTNSLAIAKVNSQEAATVRPIHHPSRAPRCRQHADQQSVMTTPPRQIVRPPLQSSRTETGQRCIMGHSVTLSARNALLVGACWRYVSAQGEGSGQKIHAGRTPVRSLPESSTKQSHLQRIKARA